MIACTVGGILVIDNISGNDVSKFKATLHRREPDRASSLSNSATLNIVFPEKKGQKMYVSTESGGVNKLLSNDITDQHLEFQHLGLAQGICPDDVLSATRFGDDVVIVSIDDISIYAYYDDIVHLYPTVLGLSAPLLRCFSPPPSRWQMDVCHGKWSDARAGKGVEAEDLQSENRHIVCENRE